MSRARTLSKLFNTDGNLNLSPVETINNNAPFGRKNLVINGGMMVAQRSTSATVSSNGYHTLDRWNMLIAGGAAYVMSQSTDVPNAGFANSLKFDCSTADASPASGDRTVLQSSFEGFDMMRFGKGTSYAKKFTCSFWVKSTETGTYQWNIQDDDNSRMNGGTYTIDSANTWEHKTITIDNETSNAFTVGSQRAAIMEWWLSAGSTYNSGTVPTGWQATANDDRAAGLTANIASSTSANFLITGVQIESGETATDFEHRSYGEELSLCQRYYSQVNASALGSSGFGVGQGNSNTVTILDVFPPVFPMRAQASASLSAASTFTVNTGAIAAACTAKSVVNTSDRNMRITFTHTSDSGTNTGSRLMRFNTSSGFIAWDAEL